MVLELRPTEQDVEVTAGGATFHIRTLRAEDFPPFPEPPSENRVGLPAKAFVETIARVERSASRDETRPILTGVLVGVSGTELRMVATDSYRLSVKVTALESAVEPGFEANVPARALAELERLAGRRRTRSRSRCARTRSCSRSAAMSSSSRLIDGQFPNYNQLLPDAFEHELRIATRRAAVGGGPDQPMAQKNAPLRLRFAEGELTVSAQTPDVGEASQTIPVPFAGEPFEIGFNPEFLKDGLESVAADDVILKLISPLRPGLIEAGDDSGLPLPDHADPVERVGAGDASFGASGCGTSARTRARTSRSAPGLTVVHGRNGAGKTNLLEALYFGCTGRSCRTRDERQVVRFGQPARSG